MGCGFSKKDNYNIVQAPADNPLGHHATAAAHDTKLNGVDKVKSFSPKVQEDQLTDQGDSASHRNKSHLKTRPSFGSPKDGDVEGGNGETREKSNGDLSSLKENDEENKAAGKESSTLAEGHGDNFPANTSRRNSARSRGEKKEGFEPDLEFDETFPNTGKTLEKDEAVAGEENESTLNINGDVVKEKDEPNLGGSADTGSNYPNEFTRDPHLEQQIGLEARRMSLDARNVREKDDARDDADEKIDNGNFPGRDYSTNLVE
ncbi:unnamed protein product [Gordionus sp. m RMFG-2023]